VGIGGQYLDTDQTLQFFRTEHEESRLLDRRSRGVWQGIEEKSMHEKARKIADEIISDKNGYKLPDAVQGKVEEIYRKNFP
jgi:trimethylamine:corrinoid methyltransferase-like protein